MTAVLLTIHTLLVLALVGVVLLQRSEGGALGMGGGGGGGGMMSGRGTANLLTRSTTMLGAAFFATSMLLAITTDRGVSQEQILEQLTGEDAESGAFDPSEVDASDILDLDPATDAPADDAPIELPDPSTGVPDAGEDATGTDQPIEGEDQPQRG